MNENACISNQIAVNMHGEQNEILDTFRLAHAVPLGFENSLSDQHIDTNCEKSLNLKTFRIIMHKSSQSLPRKLKTISYEESNEDFRFNNPHGVNHFAIWTQSAILNFSNSTVSTREKFIIKNLPFTPCSQDEMEGMQAFVSEFPLQFHVEGDPLSKTDLIQHRINLKPNASPVCVKQFRIPQINREKLKNVVRQYEQLGVIEKYNSNFNAPAFFVKKKDSTNRQCYA